MLYLDGQYKTLAVCSPLGCGFETGDTFWHDLLSDSITGDDRDFEGFARSVTVDSTVCDGHCGLYSSCKRECSRAESVEQPRYISRLLIAWQSPFSTSDERN